MTRWVSGKTKGANLNNDIEAKGLPFVADNLSGFGAGASGGFTRYRRSINDYQLLNEYANNPLVYQCCEKNATQVASMDWGVYKVAKANTKSKACKKVSRKEAKRIRRHTKAAVSQDAEIVEVLDSPLSDILNRVNEDLNGYQLLKLTQLWLETIGRAYWYVDQNELGETRVTPLYPWRVIPLRDVSGYVVGYQYYNYTQGYMVGGSSDPKGADLSKIQTLDKEQVLDFRFVSPSDPFGGGQSPLSAAIRSVYLSSQYTDWLNATFSNRQRPDWLIIPKTENLSDEERKRIEEKVYNRVGGNNNGKPIVLDQSVSAINLSFGPTDMAPLQVQMEVEKRVAGAFGIPIPFVNADASTYSNYETALEDWARSAIAPRLNLIEQVINENLVKLGIEDDVFLCFENPVPEDKEFELEENQLDVTRLQAATIASVLLTENEKRAFLGLDPIDGGDELPEEPAAPPVPTVPTTPASPASPTGTPPSDGSGNSGPTDPNASGPAGDGSNGSGDEASGKAFDRLLKLNSKVAAGSLPRATAINLAERMGFADAKNLIGYPLNAPAPEKPAQCGCGACGSEAKATEPTVEAKGKAKPSTSKTADKIKKAVAGWFMDLKGQALKVLKSAQASDIETKADTGKLPTSFVDLDHWINDLKGSEDDLAYRVKPLIEMEAQQTANQSEDRLTRIGASPDAFSVVPHEVNAAVDKRAYRFANSTLATTQKGLQDVLSGIKEMVRDGVLEGSSNDELSQAIGDFLENASDYQAERIARTESSAAVHMGQVISAKASGIVKGFKYLVSSDACDVCQPYADSEVALSDYDDSGEVDADGAVPLHPNCSCTLQEVIDFDALGESQPDNESGDDNE